MATPTKERPGLRPPLRPINLMDGYIEYTDAEKMEIVRETLRGAFNCIEQDSRFPDEEKTRQMKIVAELCEFIQLSDRFDEFVDQHLEDAPYRFLDEKRPGLNITGWGVLRAMKDPLSWYKKVDRGDDVLATISKRSKG